MEWHHVAVRALFAYVTLLALLRVSGKRTLAQGTAFDFVLALVLGDMIDDLLWGDVPAARFTVAVGVLALAHIVVSVAAGRSERFDRLIAGRPTVALAHGAARKGGLRAERISRQELAHMLRLEGIPDERRREVRQLCLEVRGRPSLLREAWAEVVPRKDARLIGRRTR
jgi:uncharacterized membrane protein YcaP (DUF421 family)